VIQGQGVWWHDDECVMEGHEGDGDNELWGR
jgi:hypothetical protein